MAAIEEKNRLRSCLRLCFFPCFVLRVEGAEEAPSHLKKLLDMEGAGESADADADNYDEDDDDDDGC